MFARWRRVRERNPKKGTFSAFMGRWRDDSLRTEFVRLGGRYRYLTVVVKRGSSARPLLLTCAVDIESREDFHVQWHHRQVAGRHSVSVWASGASGQGN
jgi:hypothetical protein